MYVCADKLFSYFRQVVREPHSLRYPLTTNQIQHSGLSILDFSVGIRIKKRKMAKLYYDGYNYIRTRLQTVSFVLNS